MSAVWRASKRARARAPGQVPTAHDSHTSSPHPPSPPPSSPSYELCLGGSITQFHREGTQRLQVTELGLYDYRHGERLVHSGADVPASGLGGGGGSAASPLVFVGKPTSALTQLYTRGSACDVRQGMPRSSLVRFECSGGSTGGSAGGSAGGSTATAAAAAAPLTFSLVGVEESPTCFYTFTVLSSLVCEHPAVGPANALALPPPIHDIQCSALD